MRQLKAYPVGCFVEETLTSLKDAQSIVDCLEAENKRLMEIVEAVANIGIDFGFGKYEIEDSVIDKARELFKRT